MTIKLVVKDLIADGKQSLKFILLSEKYGEWIVYKPELNKKNFVYGLPYLAFFLGGYLIFLILKKKI